jgi:tetratricopeptide (TPR) repeat protein
LKLFRGFGVSLVMFRPAALFASIALSLVSVAAAAPLDNAIALYRDKKIPEARAELEKITTADPKNAAACHYLGLTLIRTRDPALFESAVVWLGKAVQLEPDNISYLFEYGGASLNLAGKNRSLGAANRGRDALEKVVSLDPAHLNAHEALYQFYQQAPWPIGSSAKANAHLEEIRKHDPDRALIVVISTKTNSKDYAEAFKLCDEALAKNPENYVVLLLYGHVAITSGQNLDPALEKLNKCLTLTPPPKAGGSAFIHWRMGNLLEKKGDKPGARAAYEASLSVDTNFAPARTALEKLN